MTVFLYCTTVHNRSGLILAILHSGSVIRTTECINQNFFVPEFGLGMLVKI